LVDPFERRQLGTTTMTVPRFGLGTGPLGGWPTAVPAKQAVATIRRAWDRGIRYFDTAPFYGHGLSEQNLGKVLPSLPRDEYVISTKVGRLLVGGMPEEALFEGIPPVTPVFDFTYEAVELSLGSSLTRLELDRVDVALIHDPDNHLEQAMSGAYVALSELRSSGRLTAVGAGMNSSSALAQLIAEGDFDCMLCAGRYTLLEQDSLDDLLRIAPERRVSVIAGGVYNSGLLVDPGPASTYDYRPASPELIRRAQQLEAVCREFEVPLKAAAIQFPFGHPAISTVIVGARTPEEVDDNLALMGLEIPQELWTTLKTRGLVREDAPCP
jgi:D-threo-aldose 1-dehydrogenase